MTEVDIETPSAADHLCTDAAAAYLRSRGLRSSVGGLASLRWRGDGPAFSRVGRHIVYTRADLDEWLRARTVRVDFARAG